MFGDDILNIYKIGQLSGSEGKKTWAWFPDSGSLITQGLLKKINIFHVFPEKMHSLN